MRQAIISTNIDPIRWRKYAALMGAGGGGGGELTLGASQILPGYRLFRLIFRPPKDAETHVQLSS